MWGLFYAAALTMILHVCKNSVLKENNLIKILNVIVGLLGVHLRLPMLFYLHPPIIEFASTDIPVLPHFCRVRQPPKSNPSSVQGIVPLHGF